MRGIIYPMITAFTHEGQVDMDMMEVLIDDAIESGVHGLFVLGSQGQGPALSLEERTEVANRVLNYVNGRLPVVIHVGTTDLRSTVQLAKAAEEAGANAIAVVPPYYYSDHTTFEINSHFAGVADATTIPMIVYNNPKYTGINITPKWLKELAEEIPAISGVKLSYSPPEALLQYLEMAPSRVAIYSGSTMNLLSTVPFGVQGSINPPAILFPKLAVALWNAIEERDWEETFRLQGFVNRVTLGIVGFLKEYGRPVFREGLRIRGLQVKDFPRWKSCEMPESAKQQLQTMITEAHSFDQHFNVK